MKPSSIMAYLYAVARVHEQNGLSFNIRGKVKHLKDYISREYALVHGPEALIPRRREGFTRKMVRDLLAALPRAILKSRVFPRIIASSWLEHNLRAVICVSASGGFRKAEVSIAEGDEFSSMHMSRASLFFVISGTIHRCPSPRELLRMQPGDQAGIIACPCKNDPLGIHFMPHPLLFNFEPSDSANTGLVLRDLALRCPVPAERVRSTPLFTYSEEGEALRRGFLDMVLQALLRLILDTSSIALYSWHSFRIGLASALKNAHAPDWVILALLRWRSASSIPGYGRIDFQTSSDWLDRAYQESVFARQVPNFPGLSGSPPPRKGLASVPNLLPASAYAIATNAEKTSEALTSVQMGALRATLPEFDDDGAVQEFADMEGDVSSEEEAP